MKKLLVALLSFVFMAGCSQDNAMAIRQVQEYLDQWYLDVEPPDTYTYRIIGSHHVDDKIVVEIEFTVSTIRYDNSEPYTVSDSWVDTMSFDR